MDCVIRELNSRLCFVQKTAIQQGMHVAMHSLYITAYTARGFSNGNSASASQYF